MKTGHSAMKSKFTKLFQRVPIAVDTGLKKCHNISYVM